MYAYIVRRLALTIVVLLGITIMTFAISNLIPADPARYAAGLEAGPEQVEKLRRELGLDRPPLVQYFNYMKNLLRGNLGISVASRRPVAVDVAEYFPATLELVLVAFVLTVIIGVPSGVMAAVRKDSLGDALTRVPSLVAVGLPIFWLGLMGQFLLYWKYHLLPVGGRLGTFTASPPAITRLYLIDSLLSGQWGKFVETLKHLILPATCLALGRIAVMTRLTRASLLEVLQQDYVRTARAKGLSNRRVTYKHALKPAFIPILTEMGMQFGWMLAGTVIVESIFAWPGVGRYAFTAIMYHDLPAVMGVTLVLTLFKVLSNLAVDVLYVWVDPRIKY
ncbi:MAG: ABC transporter permease [Acetobacteraceae bacterium]|nr:ABC transporter permease [Acetobacteraceae bacterium]